MWSDGQEQLLDKWKDYARIRSIMHLRAAGVYETAYYAIGIGAIVSSSVAALTQVTQVNDPDGRLLITVVVFTVLASIFSSLQTFFRFDKSSTEHRSASSKYDIIVHNIQETTSFARDARQDPTTFIAAVKTDMNSLIELNLSIPSWLTAEYISDVQKFLDNTNLPKIPVSGTAISGAVAVQIKELQQEDRKEQHEDLDLQDDFARAMYNKLRLHNNQIEHYQLNRLNSGTGTLTLGSVNK